MHTLGDVDADIHEVPYGTDVRGQITRVVGHERAMIDVHRILCRRGEFVTVERGVGPRDDRPRVRVGARFAYEVPSLEFFEGGGDVVEIEKDARRDPVVGVDLDDVHPVEPELSVAQVAVRGRYTSEGEALPASRNGGRRYVRDAEPGEGAQVRDLDISPVQDTGVDDPTAIVGGDVGGEQPRHSVPVAGREVGPEALVHLGCRAVRMRRLRVQFLKARERGVEVYLFEDFDVADQVAFDCENVDHPPLGIKALLRGPIQHLGRDGSEFVQPMHCLDIDADVRSEGPRGTNGCDQINRLDRYERPMIDVNGIRRHFENF